MLKPELLGVLASGCIQPPSGGCVLKQIRVGYIRRGQGQPPSGGCVLKRSCRYRYPTPAIPAAFRRLCVETFSGVAWSL